MQNKHTEFIIQTLAGVNDVSRGVTNLVDHVHDADFMADSLRGIQVTINGLRDDLEYLKGHESILLHQSALDLRPEGNGDRSDHHTLDCRTRTLGDELLFVPDRLVSPGGPAGVHGDDRKIGYWVSISCHQI